MHLLSTRRRKALATAVVCGVAGVGSLAFAAWLTTSNGSGTVKAGALQTVTIVAGIPPEDTIMPGATAGLTLKLTNPNSGDLVLKSIKPGPSSGDAVLDDDGNRWNWENQCPATSVDVQTLAGLSVAVPAGTTTVTVPDAVMMDTNAATECQGATFRKGVEAAFSTPNP
jgi:hypothetical protein